ncbi:MAG: DUF5714 domain-containing protein [Syntrophotaleaceae bacterium]
MNFQPHYWQRFEEGGIPLYLRGDLPLWFVPNQAGDRILRDLAEGRDICQTPAAARFLARLPDTFPSDYPGRSAILEAQHLRELWFHLTNACNLHCRHCMFASGPGDALEMPADRVLSLAAEAVELGCRVFALTGGEPMVHGEFAAVVRGLLAFPETRLVVLTNGMQLKQTFSRGDWDFERLHLQISVDGLGLRHDAIRGGGTFDRLTSELAWLKDRKIPFTLSMCVTSSNLTDMPGLVDYAVETGAGNLHFMWYFVRGRGGRDLFADPSDIFQSLVKTSEKAERVGLEIDNLDALRSRIFAPGGTIHDGSSSGWESAAVGPDGKLYPSAALVGIPDLATALEGGLTAAWRFSPVLQQIRKTSARGLDSPWRFLIGGGDLDHSYLSSKEFIGADPYQPLHEKIALWQILREASRQKEVGPPRLRLKMGDILESCGAHGSVALVHSNCLLALTHRDSRTVVGDFYRAAAETVQEDILNPVCYDDELVDHIPEKYRFRGYGCGSPVLDARLRAGERVVDLGCGRGIECFIAARQVGPGGRVVGVDMLDNMLALAGEGAEAVRTRLGYDNLSFQHAYLEDLTLEDGSVDVVLSNCVMNLSSHKRKAYGEIFRILDRGGRLVISDVVCDSEPGAAIRNDEQLRGECIAGALSQKDLVGILEEAGFVNIRLIKRFPYRVVRGHPFFSLTFEAFKPCPGSRVPVVNRGPACLMTNEGGLLAPGPIYRIDRQDAESLAEAVFLLDEDGAVTNLDLGAGSCCALPPEAKGESDRRASSGKRFNSGCMVCGAPLRYLPQDEVQVCSYCQKTCNGNAVCEKGHFVCDACHAGEALAVIETLCLASREKDLLALFDRIRRHPVIPLNGPEYHALVPGVILAVYRNLGGEVSAELIRNAIRRGSRVGGGSCAFWGVCGAATGVGVAFSLLLDANPLKGEVRRQVQQITWKVLEGIAALHGARCCQRDCWLALKKAAELSGELLPISLKAEGIPRCSQQQLNRECAGEECPWGKGGEG